MSAVVRKPRFLNYCLGLVVAWGIANQGPIAEAQAQDATNSPPALRAPNRLAGTNGLRPERLGFLELAGDLVGSRVQNREGLFLGTIKDLILDFSGGQVYSALVVPAYLYGPTDYFVALPAASFVEAGRDRSVADVAATNLTESPRFVTGPWDQAVVFRSMSTSFAYFGQPVSWETNASVVPPITRFSSLLDREVQNRKGVVVAQMADLVLDLPSGRILFAGLSFYGVEGNVHLAPPGAMAMARNGRYFTLELDDSRTASFIYPNPFLRADLADPLWVASAYASYGRELQFDLSAFGNADAARTVRAALSRGGTEDESGLRDVKVDASGGKVTLTGHVPSEELKARYGAIAEGIAGKGNVLNRLVVP